MKATHILDGENIYLRPITYNDTENIIRWRNSPHVRRYFIYQPLFTVESHTKWLREKVDAGIAEQFIIYSKNEGKDIGSTYLRDIDFLNKKAECGIFIGEEDITGRRLGSECISLMVEYGFKELSLHKIFARILAENTRSQRAFEKAGFIQEAYLKDEVCINGSFRDLIMMRVMRGH